MPWCHAGEGRIVTRVDPAGRVVAMEQWERRLGRVLGIGAGAVAVGAIGTAAVGVLLARMAVTPAEPEAPVRVTRLQRESSGTIVWLRGPDADLPGRYSLLTDGGACHVRLGPVLARGRDGTAREALRVDRGDLREGALGRVTGWWYTDPEELGYRAERISYPTELGAAEAWLVHPKRARKKRWAVHVHGRGALPEEAIRGVAPLARAGITSLVISYRNDPGAPLGEHGRYGVGIAESRDVDAAIAEAMRRGAQRVTLVGWSMGGTACLVAATRGAQRNAVDGLILDSPAVDWSALLRYHAAGRSTRASSPTSASNCWIAASCVRGSPADWPSAASARRRSRRSCRCPCSSTRARRTPSCRARGRRSWLPRVPDSCSCDCSAAAST